MRSSWLLFPLTVIGLAACTSDGTAPRTPAQLLVSPGADTIRAVGSTAQFVAQVLDEDGDLMTDVVVTWSSSTTSVATVDATTGVATAAGKGASTIRATADGVSGTASLVVDPTPAQVIKIAGDNQVSQANAALGIRPEVEVQDAGGTPVPGLSVSFAVIQGGGSAGSTGITGANGRTSTDWVLGDPGPQTLRVSVGTLSAEFTATAEVQGVSITTTALANGHLTLSYAEALQASGGSGSGYQWSTSGSLPPGITLDPSGQLGGTPTQVGLFPFTVRVEDDGGNTGSRTLQLQVCGPPLSLQPGDVFVTGPTGDPGCGLFLPTGQTGDRYRVGIIRTAASDPPSATVQATVRVTGYGVTGTLAAAELALPAWSPSPALSASFARALEVQKATEAFHHELRDQERRLLATESGLVPLASRPPAVGVAAAAAAAPQRIMYDPPRDLTSCNDHTDVPAFLVAENAHVAVYQDSAQRVGSPVSQSAVQKMLDYYRDYGKSVIDSYVGGTPDINGDGQIVLIVTPEVSGNVAAFVWSGDLFNRASCGASNEMEVAYFNVTLVNDVDNDNFQALGTFVHEVKHVSSLYNRIRYNARTGDNDPFHPPWLEEGTAEILAEASSRLAWASRGGSPVGSLVTLADIRQTNVTAENYHMLLKLARTVWYLSSQPNAVTVNPAGADPNHSIYGGGWHFHRFLGDAYFDASSPQADSSFFRAQNDSLATPGPDNFPSLVGKAFPALLEEYAAAVMTNGTGAPQPGRAFTTYDFPTATDILADPPPGAYPWPVTTNASTGQAAVTLGSRTFMRPMGETGLQIYEFESNGTGQGGEVNVTVGGPVRVVVVRIQ